MACSDLDLFVTYFGPLCVFLVDLPDLLGRFINSCMEAYAKAAEDYLNVFGSRHL